MEWDKRTIIEYLGGDMDGRILDSDTADPIEERFLSSQHKMMEKGKGRGSLWGVSHSMQLRMMAGDPTAVPDIAKGMAHKYTIIEFTETDTERKYKLKYSVYRADNTT